MQYLVNGLVLGGTYGLMSVAYTLVYGVAGIVNFAFGGIFMFGAFGALIAMSPAHSNVSPLLTSFGLPSWVGVVAGLAVGAVLGFIVERIAYRPLRRQAMLVLLISSLSALIMLQSIGQYIFGAASQNYPLLVSGAPFVVAGAVISRVDILVAIVACLAAVALWLMVQHSPFGRVLRAVSQDRDTAKLMGVNVERVTVVVFVAGSALAALSGVMFASLYQQASPTMGYTPGLEALVAAVLGGIGNVPGAFVGGLILGVTETYAAAYVPNGSAYQDVVAFLLLVVLLWARPQGLLGARIGERA